VSIVSHAQDDADTHATRALRRLSAMSRALVMLARHSPSLNRCVVCTCVGNVCANECVRAHSAVGIAARRQLLVLLCDGT
jgi:hypothetical protein